MESVEFVKTSFLFLKLLNKGWEKSLKELRSTEQIIKTELFRSQEVAWSKPAFTMWSNSGGIFHNYRYLYQSDVKWKEFC